VEVQADAEWQRTADGDVQRRHLRLLGRPSEHSYIEANDGPQLSPALGYPCSNALAHQTPDTVSLCKKQLDAIVKDPKSSKMERFTAYDEYGVALLNSAKKPDLALHQFTQAIDIAPNGLKSSDAEWAYVYWHRAIAESKSETGTQAEQDFAAANESLKLAEAAVDTPNSAYYRLLEERLASIMQSQHP
jgi:hypothetical protein